MKRNYTQRGCVTTNRNAAFDMLDYMFDSKGYVYWFGSYWAIYA